MVTHASFSRREISRLNSRAFELLIADIWQECEGWDTYVSNQGRDEGIDVVGYPPNSDTATAVQAKCYAPDRTVGADAIHKAGSLPRLHDYITATTVITTSDFTQPAVDRAKRMSVRLLDGTDLMELIDRYDAGDIVEWYLAGRPEDGVS